MSATSALLNKSCRTLANAWRMVKRQSRLKWVFVLLFALLCEAGLFYIFLDGLRFLDKFGGVGGMIVGRLFALFFLGLGIMLAMSSMVTAYSTMFRSEEIPFLMATPLEISQIVVYKFIESTVLSSWAFFFIVVPFIGAYAWHEKVSVMFAAWTFLFSVPFLVVCSALGAAAVMLAVRWCPRWRAVRRVLLLLGGAAVAVLWVVTRRVYDPEQSTEFALSRLVPGMMLASNILIPSSWVAEGILSLSRGQVFRGLMLFGVLTASAGLGFVVVEWLGRGIFYECWQRATSGSGNRQRRAVLFAWLERRLGRLAGDIRAMIMKDVRTFLRDPMQWSQAAIFFGLLGMYFANIRSFNYAVLGAQWKSIMVFLNVFSVSSVMCSLGARFVYPQLSLEGQAFWILGLAPTTAKRILLTKFWMALAGLLTVSICLMLLATSMLQTGGLLRGISLALVAGVSFAVCGSSCGLGAIFLDLRQRNPAAIVSGFGGTLNLVLNLVFMLAAILPYAAVFHLRAALGLSDTHLAAGIALATTWLAALTAAAVIIPLKLAIRSLAARDY
jgi:ABC-2 type transport system permease protein